MTAEELFEFESDWFFDSHYKLVSTRYGQEVCNKFNLPSEIEDEIYYEEDTAKCRTILWKYVYGEK